MKTFSKVIENEEIDYYIIKKGKIHSKKREERNDSFGIVCIVVVEPMVAVGILVAIRCLNMLFFFLLLLNLCFDTVYVPKSMFASVCKRSSHGQQLCTHIMKWLLIWFFVHYFFCDGLKKKWLKYETSE